MAEAAVVPVPSLGLRMIEVARQRDLLNLEFARLAGEFAATDEYGWDGSNSPGDWIRINCHMTGPAAADSIAVGENLQLLEKSTVGVMNGALGYAHLVVLARTADAIGESFNERELLEKAIQNSPGSCTTSAGTTGTPAIPKPTPMRRQTSTNSAFSSSAPTPTAA